MSPEAVLIEDEDTHKETMELKRLTTKTNGRGMGVKAGGQGTVGSGLKGPPTRGRLQAQASKVAAAAVRQEAERYKNEREAVPASMGTCPQGIHGENKATIGDGADGVDKVEQEQRAEQGQPQPAG